MNMLVSTAAVATAVPVAAANSDDPTFAAIEKHRRASEATTIEILRAQDLENAIPKELRKSRYTVWEEKIVETDDPRWIEHERSLHVFHEAESQATCELADLVPTSTAGILALLEYLAEYEERGDAWPDLHENENDKWGRNFYWFISRNLVESLRAMGA